MVTMSRIWDRTTNVLAGRAGILAGIATLALFLPGVIRTALTLAAAPMPGAAASPGLAGLAALFSIVVLVAAVWGQLAMIAVASDPATGSAAAWARGRARLGPALGVIVVAVVVFMLALIPFGIALARSGINWQALAASNGVTASTMPAGMTPGVAGFLAVYSLVIGVLALFVGVRIALIYPVILHERVGLGAFGRSWRLTRGLTWRLIGVALLYVVVLFVASSAARFVVGAIAGLLLGAQSPAAVFLAAAVGQAVAVAFAVLAAVFTAQLYVALADGEPSVGAAAA